MKPHIEINLVPGDILTFQADVLALKYAQNFFGVDGKVSSLLTAAGAGSKQDMKPPVGQYRFHMSLGAVAAKSVVFVGTEPLGRLDYEGIRQWAALAVAAASHLAPFATHMAMTTHGAGFGLDQLRSLQAQVTGIVSAVEAGQAPRLRRISIVEKNPGRADYLKGCLDWVMGQENLAAHDKFERGYVFVAMPFDPEMRPFYRDGLQIPVNEVGYACLRTDDVAFTGSVVEKIKELIEGSEMVIADLTGANPNVYLEVGYAWGKGKRTLLAARCADDLGYDVRQENCVIYQDVKDLQEKVRFQVSRLLGEKRS